MIEFQQLSYHYAQEVILSNIHLQLTEHRIGIIGANGSGKSSFARLINGLYLPTQGAVLVDGLNTRKQGNQIRRKVGFVFQNPDNQIIFPIVEEDLAFGLQNIGLSAQAIDECITHILACYNLSHHRYSPIHQLSGGEKQLIALSGVLVMNPDYIVLDEPTAFLDLRNKKRFFQMLETLAPKLLVVTHDLDCLQNFERILWLDKGRIVQDSSPEIVLAAYQAYMQ
jgi:biotin transport system ATP-binding protein